MACIAYAVVLLVIHFAIESTLLAKSSKVAALPIEKRAELLVQIMWLVGSGVVPVLYTMGAYEILCDTTSPVAVPGISRDIHNRWFATTPLVQIALILHVGSSLYETVVFVLHGKSWIYHLHHGTIFYAFGSTLQIRTFHIFAAWHGIVEWSNFNLCLLKISLVLNVGRGGVLEVINGVLLYLGWLLFRVLSLPALAYYYVHDVTTVPEYTLWYQPVTPLRNFVRWSLLFCTFTIWALSMVWFVPIQRGVIKALTGKQKDMIDQRASDAMLTKGKKAA